MLTLIVHEDEDTFWAELEYEGEVILTIDGTTRKGAELIVHLTRVGERTLMLYNTFIYHIPPCT